MRKSIVLPLLSVLLLSPGTATAAPTPTPSPAVRDFGNGPDRNDEAALIPEQAATLAARTAETAVPAFDHTRGYPRHNKLPIPPENPNDASIKLGLIPHHAIAARLNDLQARSDRVSAEIIGRSAGGRDLYLVTVTAPETAAQAREQDRLRRRIESGHQIPKDRYKAPIYQNVGQCSGVYAGGEGPRGSAR